MACSVRSLDDHVLLLMDVCVFFIREKEEDEMLTSVIQRMGKERPSFSFSLTVL